MKKLQWRTNKIAPPKNQACRYKFVQPGIRRKIKQSLMLRYDLQDTELISKPLLSFYAFTGCDTVKAFCGKGNLKPLKVTLKIQKYTNEFPEIREDPNISDEQLGILQRFMCDVYGHKDHRIKPT